MEARNWENMKEKGSQAPVLGDKREKEEEPRERWEPGGVPGQCPLSREP